MTIFINDNIARSNVPAFTRRAYRAMLARCYDRNSNNTSDDQRYPTTPSVSRNLNDNNVDASVINGKQQRASCFLNNNDRSSSRNRRCRVTGSNVFMTNALSWRFI